MSRLQYKMKSPVGALYLVASAQGLESILWKEQKVPIVRSLKGSGVALKVLSQAVLQLEEYFAGERQKFDIPLNLNGTEFQKQVWQTLLKIPYGKTSSYKDVAQSIKKDKAVRAVGTANGKNPISIIIPCHRVIASNGTLAGYAGGLKIKEMLLQLESGS